MNKRIINSVISKKFWDFLRSIEDEEVRALVKANSIISGGCITSMFLNEEVNDYDIYFTNYETAYAVANYYVNKFKAGHPKVNMEVRFEKGKSVEVFVKSKGVAKEKEEDIPDTDKPIEGESGEDKPRYRPVYLTSNAITLSDKVQLVLRFFGDVEEIHSNYDFVHATNYWSSEDFSLHLNEDALEAVLSKSLVYNGSKYPIASLIRTRKFIKRGWHINAGQFLKMAFQISNLDLYDTEVLQDQLTGVDAAYFSMLISELENLKENNTAIDETVVVELINDIF